MTLSTAPKIRPWPVVLRAAAWKDHALIDSGGGRKLERYGEVSVIRPEAQCLWSPALAEAVWAQADARFEASDDDEAGRWRFARPMTETWSMAWRDVRFLGRFGAFRHLAVDVYKRQSPARQASNRATHARGATLEVTEIQPWPPWAM